MKLAAARTVTASAKRARLLALLEELVVEGRIEKYLGSGMIRGIAPV